MLKYKKPECQGILSGSVVYTTCAKVFFGVLLILIVFLSCFLVGIIIST